MRKILANKNIKNKTLRARKDLSPLHKTACHMFHEESCTDFDNWLELLNKTELKNVKKWLGLEEMGMKETIIIRVTPELKADVEELAKDARRGVSDYLRLLFEDCIKERKRI